ncbi:glycosyl hydrolase [Microbacterium telephonicum]|uniref:glucan endo-1,3-beta-D-glucosidase n=1 Tax=Microbacterium telephonicum TaxID=1714841 RepID=A0A498BYN6_9MICO|nr:glycosyl hydrolase [Microbacterium telephonicum]RLK48954.1 endoglucanase Acf2 [Microbacterium telephonicum]
MTRRTVGPAVEATVAPALAVTVAVALALTGCTATAAGDAGPTSAPTVSPAASVDLPVERLATPPSLRVAADVIPPTNRWYSSLAFAAEDVPVYPFPLAVAPTPEGFTVGVPPVRAGASTIGAAFAGGLGVALAGADGGDAALERIIVRADEVSVTLEYADTAGPLARVTLAEGSPVVGVVASRKITITLSQPVTQEDGGAVGRTADGAFLIAGAAVDDETVTLDEGDALQVAGLPADADPSAWAAALGAPVGGVTVSASGGDGSATTTLRYDGTDRTVVVPFDGAEADGACDLGTYDTPYGDVPACAATTLVRTVPTISPASRYDLEGLSATDRDALTAQIAADLDGTAPAPADTYFGGKALARLAALHEVAEALGDDGLADRVADRLATELDPWLDPDGCRDRDARCFVYDDRLRLVVGKSVSFGSEEGNDHHFHYGYFLFAAGVLGAARPDLVAEMTPVMTALAADIVTGAADGALPALRTFDPYRGHSWASGFSPFADGNNQESSSEAVAAWNGVALWGAASGDEALRARAVWLLSTEADAARRLWLEPAALAPAYEHPIVSLTWSAKRDYATWFSPEPSAILGIQLLPLGPVALEYLGEDPARVAVNLEDAGDAAYDGPLGDYVTGYASLAGADALAAARTRIAQRSEFDDGWSKALAEAWIAAVELRSG